MSIFPSDPAKIKARIKSYERTLKKEYKTYGFYDDGYGKRYLLGPMYLLIGDYIGAMRSYEWFEKTFPDDSGEPYQSLCWILALYKTDNKKKAREKLIMTMFMNIYLIPFILDIEQPKLPIWHGSNLAEKLYALECPKELIDLWETESIEFLKGLWLSPEIKKIREEYISLLTELNKEKQNAKRGMILNKISLLEKGAC